MLTNEVLRYDKSLSETIKSIEALLGEAYAKNLLLPEPKQNWWIEPFKTDEYRLQLEGYIRYRVYKGGEEIGVLKLIPIPGREATYVQFFWQVDDASPIALWAPGFKPIERAYGDSDEFWDELKRTFAPASSSTTESSTVEQVAPKREISEKVQKRAIEIKRIKDAHPEYSQLKLAMEARKILNDDTITADTVRNDYEAMGWKWERSNKIR